MVAAGSRAGDRDRIVAATAALKASAAAGSLLFFLVAPCVVAGVVPWLLTGWDTGATWLPAQLVGAFLIAAGTVVLVHAFVRFVVEGLGTPAPIAPTRRLVVGGLYRYVRNPMYVAVGATIVGQALLLGRYGLLLYAAAFGAAVFAFVRGYEEPTLQRQFGESYDEYRRNVPGWWPRRRSWRG